MRILEKLKFHTGRQPFLLGILNEKYNQDDLRQYLETKGFGNAVLAWKDSDELLSMRKVDKRIFQWHIRLHSDGEIRGHYEYSSEGNPYGHIFQKVFRPETESFVFLLGDYLVPDSRKIS